MGRRLQRTPFIRRVSNSGLKDGDLDAIAGSFPFAPFLTHLWYGISLAD